MSVMGAAGADKVEEGQEEESVLAEGRALPVLDLGQICSWENHRAETTSKALSLELGRMLYAQHGMVTVRYHL